MLLVLAFFTAFIGGAGAATVFASAGETTFDLSNSSALKTSPVNVMLFISSTPANFTVKCFSKCPAFAAEYGMTLIRVLRTHFGPLNRKEAQAVPVCESLLSQVQTLINSDPESACAELF